MSAAPAEPPEAPGTNPRDRFTLLDLMAIVAAFGVGLGFGAMLPGGERSAKLMAGMVMGAMLVPPGVLAARRVIGRDQAPLRAGERFGLLPLFLLMLPILAALDRGGLTMLFLLAWIIGLFFLCAAAWGTLLARLCEKGPTRMTWLEIYGYLLGLAMGGLAVWILAAGLR